MVVGPFVVTCSRPTFFLDNNMAICISQWPSALLLSGGYFQNGKYSDVNNPSIIEINIVVIHTKYEIKAQKHRELIWHFINVLNCEWANCSLINMLFFLKKKKQEKKTSWNCLYRWVTPWMKQGQPCTVRLCIGKPKEPTSFIYN